MNQYRERIYQLARQIPKGRVMTYGQIAEILDTDKHTYTAQTVGWAMHALGDTDCWARVINAKGACSTGKVMLPGNKQQIILENEGVIFNPQGRCDLQTFLLIPDDVSEQTPAPAPKAKPRTDLIKELHEHAHALRPARLLKRKNEIRLYEGTTFPKNPRQGCLLHLRRCQTFGYLKKDDAHLLIDVLDAEGDILQEFPITREGFNYLRRQLKFKVEPSET